MNYIRSLKFCPFHLPETYHSISRHRDFRNTDNRHDNSTIANPYVIISSFKYVALGHKYMTENVLAQPREKDANLTYFQS